MSEPKKLTARLTHRAPPVFHVQSIEVSPNGGPEHVALRFETPCRVCFEFRLTVEFALELASALERAFQKKEGLPE